MVRRKIMAVCYQIHTKHINTVCGQNVELLNDTLVVRIVTTGLYSFIIQISRTCGDPKLITSFLRHAILRNKLTYGKIFCFSCISRSTATQLHSHIS